jgi:hypothetical protein
MPPRKIALAFFSGVKWMNRAKEGHPLSAQDSQVQLRDYTPVHKEHVMIVGILLNMHSRIPTKTVWNCNNAARVRILLV